MRSFGSFLAETTGSSGSRPPSIRTVDVSMRVGAVSSSLAYCAPRGQKFPVTFVTAPSSTVSHGESFLRADYMCTGLDQPPDGARGYYWVAPSLKTMTWQGVLAELHSKITNLLWADGHSSGVSRSTVWSVGHNQDLFDQFWAVRR